MESLTHDIVIVIVKHARCGTYSDLQTLQSISGTCWALNRVLHSHHSEIIDYYTVCSKDKYDSIRYRLFGNIHRDGDLPAIICEDGGRFWYQHGYRHRDNDLPAIITPRGTQSWFQRGLRHRDDDKPAVITSDGRMYYYKNGVLHRDDNKPAIVFTGSTRVEYWTNGMRIL